MEWEKLLQTAENWHPDSDMNISGRLVKRIEALDDEKSIALAQLVLKTLKGYSKRVCDKIDSDPYGAKEHRKRLYQGYFIISDVLVQYNNFIHYHGGVGKLLDNRYWVTINELQTIDFIK